MWYYKKRKDNKNKTEDIINEILTKRGVDPTEYENIMSDCSCYKKDPLRLKGVDKFIERIKIAMKNKEEITIYGDSDSDGVHSTCLMINGLEEVGLTVHYVMGDRAIYGFGLTNLSIDSIIEKYPNTRLVITVDNGSSSLETVEYAKTKGLEVIVTDHHECPEVPDCIVINPKQKDSEYPFRELCGAGVAYKALEGLFRELGKSESDIEKYLDIVAVATIGDVVQLLDENRYFVKKGLDLLKRTDKPLYKTVIGDRKVINEHFVAYTLVPTVNSAGRLKSAELALKALMGDESAIADLIITNEDRKTLSNNGFDIALNSNPDINKNIIIINDSEIHPGVAGIVAGKLKDEYELPAIVLTIEKNALKGSMRSVPWLNCFDFLQELSPYLAKYGGHAQAGGFTIKDGQVDAFIENSYKFIENLSKIIDISNKKYLDVVIEPKYLTLDMIKKVEQLAPFGAGFEKPTFGLKDFKVQGVQKMGEAKNHLKIKGDAVNVIMFNCENLELDAKPGNLLKVVGSPSINEYKGSLFIQFIAKEFI